MNTYELTKDKFDIIYKFFNGYVFNRTSEDRYYIKLSPKWARKFNL